MAGCRTFGARTFSSTCWHHRTMWRTGCGVLGWSGATSKLALLMALEVVELGGGQGEAVSQLLAQLALAACAGHGRMKAAAEPAYLPSASSFDNWELMLYADTCTSCRPQASRPRLRYASCCTLRVPMATTSAPGLRRASRRPRKEPARQGRESQRVAGGSQAIHRPGAVVETTQGVWCTF